MTIWKFPLLITDRQSLLAPALARPLSVGLQFGQPCLWAQVEETQPLKSLRIAVVGTGNPMPVEPSRFLGTLITAGDRLIWHVFQLLDPS